MGGGGGKDDGTALVVVGSFGAAKSFMRVRVLVKIWYFVSCHPWFSPDETNDRKSRKGNTGVIARNAAASTYSVMLFTIGLLCVNQRVL